jgi:hypothetical protein
MPEERRNILNELRLFVTKQTRGNHSRKPWVGREPIHAGRRGCLQCVAIIALELEENRAPSAGRRNRVMVEHREQVAEAVGGRQCLEQAGLA